MNKTTTKTWWPLALCLLLAAGCNGPSIDGIEFNPGEDPLPEASPEPEPTREPEPTSEPEPAPAPEPEGEACGGAARNACGGCEALVGAVGDVCGVCGSGRLACDVNNLDAYLCVGDRGDSARNACGGCATLAGTLDAPCTQGGCSGQFECNGIDALVCVGPGLNECGGCVTLTGQEGDPCGECGLQVCDGTDGLACEEQVTTFFADQDGDQFGNSQDSRQLCVGQTPHVATVGGDCNDTDLDINPSVPELCDLLDNDCDETIDEGLPANGCGGCGDLDPDLGTACLNCGPSSFVCLGSEETECELNTTLLARCLLDTCLHDCGDGTCSPAESCQQCDLDCACDAGCGDGIVGGTEVCDDGNRVAGDLCDNNCRPQDVLRFAGSFVHLRNIPGGFVAAYGRDNRLLEWQRFNHAGVAIDPQPLGVPGANNLSPPSTTLGGLQFGDGNFLISFVQDGRIQGRRFSDLCVPTVLGGGADFYERAPFGMLAGAQHDKAAIGANTLALVWAASGAFPDMNGSGILVMRFNNEGQPLDANPLQVNGATQGFQINPQVAALSNGGFVVAWIDTGDNNRVKARRFDALARPLGGDIRVNAVDRGQTDIVKIVALSGGRFAVAWGYGLVDGDTFLRVFSNTGTPLNPNDVLVNQEIAGAQNLSSMAASRQDKLFVAWNDANNDSMGSFFDVGGNPLGPEILLRASTGSRGPHTVIPLDDGDFVPTLAIPQSTDTSLRRIPTP